MNNLLMAHELLEWEKNYFPTPIEYCAQELGEMDCDSFYMGQPTTEEVLGYYNDPFLIQMEWENNHYNIQLAWELIEDYENALPF